MRPISYCLFILVSHVVSAESTMYKIFSADEAYNIKHTQPFVEISGPFWTPEIPENVISQIVRKIAKEVCEMRGIDIFSYQFQVIGITEAEKKVLYLNFFTKDYGLDEFVYVLDGGADFFQVKYDLRSTSIIAIQINGEA